MQNVTIHNQKLQLFGDIVLCKDFLKLTLFGYISLELVIFRPENAKCCR